MLIAAEQCGNLSKNDLYVNYDFNDIQLLEVIILIWSFVSLQNLKDTSTQFDTSENVPNRRAVHCK